MRVEHLYEDYNWQEAFDCAKCKISAAHNSSVSTKSFEITDVKRVISLDDGENDEASWVGAFELKDGRFVFISSWCDYTGWD